MSSRPPVFKPDDVAFFFASKYCFRHFLIEDERNEHDKVYHERNRTTDLLNEALREIPELEDK